MDATRDTKIEELDEIRLLTEVTGTGADDKTYVLKPGERGTVLVARKDSYLAEFGILPPGADLMDMIFVEASVEASQCEKIG